jgi:hypothetical protein
MSIGNLPPEDKINIDQDGTNIDTLGDNTTIEALVGGIETTDYDITIEMVYTGPGSEDSFNDIISSREFEGIVNPNDSESLSFNVATHPVVAGNQTVHVEMFGQIDGQQVNKVWEPGLNPEPLGDHVYINRFESLQNVNSLTETILYEVNVQNDTISNVDVSFSLDGAILTENSIKGINTAYSFSTTRELEAELQGNKEVCCSLTGLQSTGRA